MSKAENKISTKKLAFIIQNLRKDIQKVPDHADTFLNGACAHGLYNCIHPHIMTHQAIADNSCFLLIAFIKVKGLLLWHCQLWIVSLYIYNNTTNQYSKVTQKNLKFLEKLLTKSKSNWEHLNNIFFITFILLSFLFYFLMMLCIPRENIWSSKWYHDIIQNKTSQHLQPQIQMIGVIVVVETNAVSRSFKLISWCCLSLLVTPIHVSF